MKTRSLAVALALGLLFTAACGDDDDDTDAATEDTASASGEGEEAAGGDDFCTAYSELLAGDPNPEQIREVAAVAPEAAAEHLNAIADGAEADPEGFFDTEEFGESFAAVGEIANDECADEVLDVAAIDYGFEGLPTELDAGIIGINFTNEGSELHEMVVFRKAEGVTQSFDELLALEDEEAEGMLEEVSGTFAFPGESQAGLFDMTEAGEYVAVCFIPVGTTPEAAEADEESDAPPHFTQGMQSEFTVS